MEVENVRDFRNSGSTIPVATLNLCVVDLTDLTMVAHCEPV